MYWCCAQVEPRRERLASYCLTLAGYEIYQPLLREQRRSHGRRRLIELPKLRLAPGMRVKVLQGPLQDQIGLLAVLRPHERVLVLLRLLGGQQRVELARNAIEAVDL